LIRINIDEVNGKKLVPVIFTHGNGGQVKNSSGHCREMASHGYIVFGIDHNDGSCAYTEDQNGK
jgi:predicted dienelactone hydrolase